MGCSTEGGGLPRVITKISQKLKVLGSGRYIYLTRISKTRGGCLDDIVYVQFAWVGPMQKWTLVWGAQYGNSQNTGFLISYVKPDI